VPSANLDGFKAILFCVKILDSFDDKRLFPVSKGRVHWQAQAPAVVSLRMRVIANFVPLLPVERHEMYRYVVHLCENIFRTQVVI
jgi:hypothetical protein